MYSSHLCGTEAPALSITSATKILHLLVLAPVLWDEANDHLVLVTCLSASRAIVSCFQEMF